MRTWRDLTQAAENFRNVWAVKPREDATSGKKGSKGCWNLSYRWGGERRLTLESLGFTGYNKKLTNVTPQN